MHGADLLRSVPAIAHAVDHLAHFVVDLENFENTESSAVAGEPATLAAFRFEEVVGCELLRVEAQRGDLGFGQRGGFLASAELAAETLGHDGADGAGDQKRFHPDVDESGDGARGVVGVQGGEYQVAGEGGIDGDAGRFEVTNFTNHDDVRRLTQDGPQGAGEGHSNVRFDVDLIDAGHDVFDRVLDGDDFPALVVDFGEAGVEGGGFTGSGGAGDKNDAVGHLDEAAEIFLVVAHEAEVGEGDRESRLVEQTHDDRLALRGGDGRDTQVEILAAHLALDAAVLRDALLVDAHGLRHDLQAADDGALQHLGQQAEEFQFAVDAEADAEAFLDRLEVDVAGPHFLRFLEELLDEFDDGSVIVGRARFLFFLGARGKKRVLKRENLGQKGLHELGIGVEEFDLFLEQERDAVEGIEVQGVADGDLQSVVGLLKR